jgi:predicted hydrocarbon binding protein
MSHKDSITLSPKHGVNPSITHCECCGKEIGIALFGRLKKDEEAPRDIAMGLCDDCQKVIDAKGLIIIEVRDGESSKNPYRTGRLIGITKDAKERMFKDINSPVCYMEQSMFNAIFGKVEFKQ